MSADTLETIAEEVDYVEKLEIIRSRACEVVVGGAGRSELIDGFIQDLTKRVNKRRKVLNEKQLSTLLETALGTFYDRDVASLSGKYKEISFLIAARLLPNGGMQLWRTKARRLFEVRDRAAIGYGGTLGRHAAKRLFQPDLSLGQMVLASVYILVVAKTTSRVVGGPTSVVLIRDNGISREDEGYVTALEDRLKVFERHVNEIFLHCADTGLNPTRFEGMLVDFCAQALSLHQSYIADVFQGMVRAGLNSGSGDAYPKLPPGFTGIVAAGDMDNVYTPDQKAALIRRIREEAKRISWGGAMPSTSQTSKDRT